MSIKVQCGQCSKRYAAPDKLAGQRVMCPECGAAVNVPAAGPEQKTPPKNPAADLLSEELGEMEIPFAESGPPVATPAQGLPKTPVQSAAKGPQKQQLRPSGSRRKSPSKFQLSRRNVAITIGVAALLLGAVLVRVLLVPGSDGSARRSRPSSAADMGPTQPVPPGPVIPPAPPQPGPPGPPEPGPPPTGDPDPNQGPPSPNEGPPTEPNDGQPPGYSQYPNTPGGPVEPAEESQRPEDVAKWKGQDFYDARREGDPRLIEAVGQLTKRAPGNINVAKNLAKLLAPPVPEEGPAQKPRTGYGPPSGRADPRLIQALVAALGINGTDAARAVLGQLLAGTLETDDDKTAVDAALKALVDHPSAKTDEILFGVLTAAEKLRPEPKGQIGADELREMTLAGVRSTASEALRTKLAGYMIQPATPQEWRDQMGEFLAEEHPDNVGAQLILYQSDQAAGEMRATLEQYFIAYSSAAMGHVLGIPATADAAPGQGPGANRPGRPTQFDGPVGPGGSRSPRRPTQYDTPFGPGGPPGRPGQPTAPSAGPGWTPPGGPNANQPNARPADPDAPYRRARQLWSAQTVAIVQRRLGQLESLEDQSQLLILAGTFPVDSMRSAVRTALYEHRADGPEQLEAAGLSTSLISDPGMLLTIKTLPRRMPADTGSSPGGTPGGSYRQPNRPQRGDFRRPGNRFVPGGRPRPGQPPSGTEAVEAARDAVQRELQAEQDWMKTSEDLVRAWCERFHAAGTAGSNPGQGGSKASLPIRLHPEARIVSEYHLNWPGDLGAKLSGVAPGPMEVHYVRTLEKAEPITRTGFYRRQVGLERDKVRTIEGARWCDRLQRVRKPKEQGPIDKTGWRRSVDVLIAAVEENPEPNRAGEIDLVVQILSIEMKNPVKAE